MEGYSVNVGKDLVMLVIGEVIWGVIGTTIGVLGLRWGYTSDKKIVYYQQHNTRTHKHLIFDRFSKNFV